MCSEVIAARGRGVGLKGGKVAGKSEILVQQGAPVFPLWFSLAKLLQHFLLCHLPRKLTQPR